MKGLAILTHRAQREANPGKRIDRRKLPTCAQEGCRRKVEALPGGHLQHCYTHASEQDRHVYQDAWRLYSQGTHPSCPGQGLG